MSWRRAILAFVGMLCVSMLAIAETPRAVNVPAGDLIEALESLARQCGVDVIYPSSLLKGQKTQGVSGMLESLDAFRRLLAGTPLALREEGGALLITQAPAAPQPAMPRSSPEESIDEVEIEGRRANLSEMRAEIAQLEEQFYAAYNKVNTVPEYDVACTTRMPSTGSHVGRHSCEPLFVTLARTSSVTSMLEGHGYYPLHLGDARQTRDYQQRMVALVARHPELLQLAKEHYAALQRYETARSQMFNGTRTRASAHAGLW